MADVRAGAGGLKVVDVSQIRIRMEPATEKLFRLGTYLKGNQEINCQN